MALSSRSWLLILIIAIILFAGNAHAFGAGNIASISAIEGKNWRHGDLEDVLKQVACIRHHKWNTIMIKRVYFGNWLRDYSQAVDVGTLKKTNSETIRILVWLLSFLGFGYATAEFEVTAERLGTYRPEEHIDNPRDYNDNEDARTYDKRLRGPVRQIELDIDPETGMKNYIANGKGDWATSLAYVKYSFERSIHHGRSYTSGSGFLSKGNDADLAEALRCLGQGLHTLEDFGAHTNYVELALVELGHRNVFPLVGTQTGITLRGKHVFPLVTGTFGAVDFYHSVLGEATDHFTQSEVNEMDNAMGIAQQSAKASNPLTTLIKLLAKVPGTRDLCVEAERLQSASHAQAMFNSQRGFGDESTRGFDAYSETTRSGPDDWNASRSGYDSSAYPGAGHQQSGQQWNAQPNTSYHELPTQNYNDPHQQQQHNQWQQPPGQQQQQQQHWNDPQNSQAYGTHAPAGDQYGQQPSHDQWQQPPQQTHTPDVHPQPTPAAPNMTKPVGAGSTAQPQGIEGMPDFDPAKFVQQIYPILAFRDKVVRTISSIIEKIPGLEALVDKIVETLTVFILSLLAPFVRPVIKALTKSLQMGSEGVIDSSGRHQFEVFTNPQCSDPTHSMLSKDHFSNILNPPAGAVAAEIVKFIAPRVLFAWEHPDVPVDRVMADLEHVFHHPAIRDEHNECHRNMFEAVRRWMNSLPDRGSSLDVTLGQQGVRDGKNHKGGVNEHLAHGSGAAHGGQGGSFAGYSGQSYAHSAGPGAQGGFSGYIHQAQNLLGGQGGHQGGHNTNQGGIGGYLNQALGSFSGQGHGTQQHYGGSGAQHTGGHGGGLNDMMSLANKLPIPGVHNVTSQINKFNKFSGFMGGGSTREIDGSAADSGSSDYRGREIEQTGVGAVDDIPTTGYEGVAIPQTFAVGGAGDLHDAAQQAGRDRSPSPMPLAAPPGYESYSTGGTYDGSAYGAQQGGYTAGSDYQGTSGGYYSSQHDNQYGSQYGGQYNSSGGGEGGSYYRG